MLCTRCSIKEANHYSIRGVAWICKWVSDKEFCQIKECQIRIKKYGLGHTIPWKYNVQDGPCEK